MYQSLDIFQTANAMASHAGARQAVVARNIANADTPDFKAQHISPFYDHYRLGADLAVTRTRASHLNGTAATQRSAMIQDSTAEASPNGNTVSLETELLNSVAVAREHNRALTIYRHAMTVLRTTLGRG